MEPIWCEDYKYLLPFGVWDVICMIKLEFIDHNKYLNQHTIESTFRDIKQMDNMLEPFIVNWR